MYSNWRVCVCVRNYQLNVLWRADEIERNSKLLPTECRGRRGRSSRYLLLDLVYVLTSLGLFILFYAVYRYLICLRVTCNLCAAE